MKKQTAGRDKLGTLAPQFAELNDDVLFGEVWSREDKLGLKERSMITIAALMAQGLFPQVKEHLELGKEHGITREEAVEIVTQLGFYCSWASSWNTFSLIAEVYGDEDTDSFSTMFGLGKPNDAYAKYFTGKSYLNPLTKTGECSLGIFNVTFKSGARNNWHIHKASKGGGQVLICTDGLGVYQEEHEMPKLLKPGDVVVVPAGVKHWHGAQKRSWFSHIAIEVPGENAENVWLEPVSDEEYNKI